MPAREAAPSVAVIRAAVGRRVEATSLRQAALEVGISHQALHAFVRGSAPYGKNLGKLREWFTREGGADAMRGMAAAMLADVPPEHREDAARELIATVVRLHRRYGVPAPAWATGEPQTGRKS